MNIIKHSDVSATLKKEILKEVRLIEKLSAYREYDIYDIEQLLELITLETQTKEEALSLADQPLDELCQAANELREHFCDNVFDLCSIINGKSGKCSGTGGSWFYLRRQSICDSGCEQGI